MDDILAFDLIIRQDPAGLEHLMQAYGLLVLRVIRQVLGGDRPDDIEECAGDVWMTVWQKAGQYDSGKSSGKTWICAVARHKAVDYLRKRRNPARMSMNVDPQHLNEYRAEMKEIPEILEQREESRETAANLNRALSMMPESDRQLLIRRYYFFEDIADLAKSMGITRSAADNRLSRGRKLLRDLFREVDGDGC